MTACDLRSGFGLCGVNERSEAMLTSFSFARIHRELDERDRGHPSGRHRKTSFAASRPWMTDCSGDRAPRLTVDGQGSSRLSGRGGSTPDAVGHSSGRHRKTSFAASRPWMIDCSGDRAPSDSRRGRSSLASRSWRIDPRRCWAPVRASSQDVVRGFAAVDDRLLRRPGTVR